MPTGSSGSGRHVGRAGREARMSIWPVDCFEGSNVLISGGTSGIGAAIAAAFAAEGATVTVTGATDAEVARARDDMPDLRALTLDVRDAGAVAETAVVAAAPPLPPPPTLPPPPRLSRRFGATLTPATNATAFHATVARPLLRGRPRPRHGHCRCRRRRHRRRRHRRCRRRHRRRRAPVRHRGGRRCLPHRRGLAAAAALRPPPARLLPPPPQPPLSRLCGAFLSPSSRLSRGLPLQSCWA